jgi:hypothetical protein
MSWQGFNPTPCLNSLPTGRTDRENFKKKKRNTADIGLSPAMVFFVCTNDLKTQLIN